VSHFWMQLIYPWRFPHFRVRSEIHWSLIRAGIWLAVIIVLHVIAMNLLEGMSWGDGLWLTLTTVTTVGYGDMAATTALGRFTTVILVYGGGIFILGKFAGDYFEYRSHLLEQKIKGHWSWNMRGHILILNEPISFQEQYLRRLVRQFREIPLYRERPIQILTDHFPMGLPQSLREMDVAYYHGKSTDPKALVAVNAAHAAIIVVLVANEGDAASDGITFDILHRLKEAEVPGRVLAECVDDRNRERLLRAGANAVVRPIRAYPAMIVRAFTAPGAEQVIENMFTHKGDEYQRFELNVRQTWGRIVCSLVNADVGIPVAYVSAEKQEVISNPSPEETIQASALLVMVREGNSVSLDHVRDALRTLS
jgi:voltage-gated potassium channel